MHLKTCALKSAQKRLFNPLYYYFLPASKRDRSRTFVGESFFLILVSSFSLSRPSAHFCLCDLSRIPTNFWRGPCYLPLITYFFRAIFSLHVAPYFLHSTTAYVRKCAQNIVSSSDRLNPQLRHRRHSTHCSHNVSPWSFHVPFFVVAAQ